MHFTFRNNNNNNPPTRITARETTEQKLIGVTLYENLTAARGYRVNLQRQRYTERRTTDNTRK